MAQQTTVYAGRFDFEDGGTYCGGWEDGKAHGHGVCTGPKSMGEFSGLWQFGYEVTGVYIWPSGNCYLGQWMSGKRHGLGIEKKQRWIYKGEWSQGFKGRYGVRMSEASGAKYEGTWANGLQDGYGSETYADGGTYFGQMGQGMRNGYGIRKSVAYGVASRYRSKDVKDSLTSLRSEDGDEKVQRERDRRFDENRGGFVLRAKSDLTEEVAAGVTSLILSTNQTVGGGNIMTNAINGLLRRRRNSLTHPHHQPHANPNNAQSTERKPSLRKTLMSKLKKQKSVGDIDEVNAVGGGGGHGGSNMAINKLISSSGRANKKSSFRSTSSNNSVDSRASNRTAPAGLSAVNALILNGQLAYGVNIQPQQHGAMDDGEHSFISQDEITDINCIEVYMGEWKQDKRTGFGIAERSDGLKYEGEWFNNKKNGYGVTTFKDGTKEEGKYKNNVLATDKKKSAKLLLLRTNKLRQKIDAAVNAALKAGQIAQQRADIALARAVNARTKAHAAELGAKQALADSENARVKAKEVAPDFVQPGELKKSPEIMLDIDRMQHGHSFQPQTITQLTNISDPVVFSNISPNSQQQQFRNQQQAALKQQQSSINLNLQTGGPLPPHDTYLNWHQQQQIHQSSYTPHSSTPPPSSLPRSVINSQYYDPSLIISTNQLQQQQNLMQQAAGGTLMDSPGTKLNNDMLGYDAQAIAQLQMQQSHYMPQQQPHKPHHMFQRPNYSFDDHLQAAFYNDPNNPQRLSLLQQAQSHSFNMDNPTPQQLEFMHQQQQQQIFQRNMPRRNTLKRSQRLNNDGSVEDDSAASNPAAVMLPTELMGLTPQQQQQYLMMRSQQYSHSSNTGQESGLSSMYTNSAHGANELINPNLLHLSQQQQQQQRQHHHHHRQHHHVNNISPHSVASHSSHDPHLNAASSEAATSSAATSLPLVPALPPRRKSLPSMVKTKSFKEDETAHSSSELNRKNQELYIIENGIRKRVTERTNSALNNNNQTSPVNSNRDDDEVTDAEAAQRLLPRTYNYEDEGTMELPRKIVLESITSLNAPCFISPGTSKRVSMPSIPAYLNPKFANKVMSREEANRLSSLRRDELRKNEELEKNKILKIRNMLRNNSIGMFFKTTVDCSIQTDDEDYFCRIKDGFLRNRIFLFIILFNISLAIWFLQMLK